MSGTAGGGGHGLGLFICMAPGQGRIRKLRPPATPRRLLLIISQRSQRCPISIRTQGQEAEQERGGREQGRRPGDEAGEQPARDIAPAKHGFRFLPRLSAAFALYVGQRTDEAR